MSMILSKSRSLFLIYLVSMVIVFLVLFEFLILPWHFKLPRDLALVGFAAEPNIVLDDTSINSMGFTGDVISLEKDEGKIRILTLGGSAMFNRQMTVKFKKNLETVFDSPLEIVGAALRSHTSMSSVIKYKYLSKYKFDYVLIYHGINDLFVNHVEADYFKRDYSHMMPWYKRSFLLDNSLIARVVYNNFIWARRVFGGQKIWYIYPKDEIENRMNFISEELFEQNLSILIKEIRQNEGIPVLMTFAWSIPDNYTNESFRSGTLGYNNPTEYDQYPVELWGSTQFVLEGLQRHNTAMHQLSKEQNVLLIDQEKLIGKDLRSFGDVCHLSEEGTKEFIQNITNFFIEKDLL